MPEFHLPLAAEDRGVAAKLQTALVELIDLALIGKPAPWNIAGADYRCVRSDLEKPADEEARHGSAGGQCDLGTRIPPRWQPWQHRPEGYPDER